MRLAGESWQYGRWPDRDLHGAERDEIEAQALLESTQNTYASRPSDPDAVVVISDGAMVIIHFPYIVPHFGGSRPG